MPPDIDIEKQTPDSPSDSLDPEDGDAVQKQETPILKYRNSLLAAVAYLDLANALDFPANVWNQIPAPLYAKVLMGVGGSIAILSTAFAFWDAVRAWRNITFLREERAELKQRQEKGRLTLVEEAWLSVNTRELGWEVIDRMMLDAFMAAAGILVGTGCLMAIRGDIHAVFVASNVLSGYLGNSFVALYAVINTVWCVFMWRRAHACEGAVKRADREIGAKMMMALKAHSRRHKIYAIVNGLSILVSGVGSEISSTMWPGYVVLIPCILGSIFCNYFWRYCLGYDRTSFQHRQNAEGLDARQRLSEVMQVRDALMHSSAASIDCYDYISGVKMNDDGKAVGFLSDLGLGLDCEDFVSLTSSDTMEGKHARNIGHVRAAVNRRIQRTDVNVFKYEERLLLELYGYYLLARECPDAQEKDSRP